MKTGGGGGAVTPTTISLLLALGPPLLTLHKLGYYSSLFHQEGILGSGSLLRIDNSRQERFGSGRAYPHFIHSYLMASLMIIH